MPRPADPAEQGSSEPGLVPAPELQPLQRFRDRFVIVRRDGREEPIDTPEMVYLPGGIFGMGDERGGVDEKPVHWVRLPAFALGSTPVTWGDYRRFCAAAEAHWPEWLEPGSQYNVATGEDSYYARRDVAHDALDLPVVGVSWADAAAYCAWLRERTGKIYRLPSEAEWEYACRAGTKTRWSFGDEEGKLAVHAWYAANSHDRLHPVAEKRPNRWGLYEMHGTVWEWCADWYAGDYYKQLARAAIKAASSPGKVKTRRSMVEHASTPLGIPPTGTAMDAASAERHASESPSGPESGSYRVIRGGSWVGDAGLCRSAFRHWEGPLRRRSYLGFRLAMTV